MYVLVLITRRSVCFVVQEPRVIGRSAHLGIIDEEISEKQVRAKRNGAVATLLQSRALLLHDVICRLPLSIYRIRTLLTISDLSTSEQLECRLTFSPMIALELKVSMRVVDQLSNV